MRLAQKREKTKDLAVRGPLVVSPLANAHDDNILYQGKSLFL